MNILHTLKPARVSAKTVYEYWRQFWIINTTPCLVQRPRRLLILTQTSISLRPDDNWPRNARIKRRPDSWRTHTSAGKVIISRGGESKKGAISFGSESSKAQIEHEERRREKKRMEGARNSWECTLSIEKGEFRSGESQTRGVKVVFEIQNGPHKSNELGRRIFQIINYDEFETRELPGRQWTRWRLKFAASRLNQDFSGHIMARKLIWFVTLVCLSPGTHS